jgi:uncharacterized protein (DUF2141 family)
MKKIPAPAAAMALLITGMFLQAPAAVAQEGGTLRVVATNVSSDAGTIEVWVYENEDTWLSDRYRTRKAVPVKGNLQGDTVTLELLLPPGEYALSVFHDENGDGKLARNFIGIPKEPAGFSNNYRPKGPPRFAKAAFQLGSEPVEQRIRLQ